MLLLGLENTANLRVFYVNTATFMVAELFTLSLHLQHIHISVPNKNTPRLNVTFPFMLHYSQRHYILCSTVRLQCAHTESPQMEQKKCKCFKTFRHFLWFLIYSSSGVSSVLCRNNWIATGNLLGNSSLCCHVWSKWGKMDVQWLTSFFTCDVL